MSALVQSKSQQFVVAASPSFDDNEKTPQVGTPCLSQATPKHNRKTTKASVRATVSVNHAPIQQAQEEEDGCFFHE